MEPIARETIALPGGDGLLVVARQSENGVAMRKWALLTRTEDMTVVVVASLPDAAKDSYPDAALRDALGSVTVRAKLPPDADARRSAVSVGRSRRFPAVAREPGRHRGADARRRTTPPCRRSSPISRSRCAPPIRRRPPSATASRCARSRSSSVVRTCTWSAPAQVRIGGEQGHEIVAESRDARTGDEFMLVQWLRFGTSGFVQMFGTARKDQWAAVLPRMRTLRDGFGLR